MDQAHRGLADTALNVGVDVSDRISILYAPPAAWSHGYLWGADVAEIPLDSGFSPVTTPLSKTTTPDGGVESGRAEAYALELDSPTAVRTLNALIGGGLTAKMANDAFPAKTGGTLPAGTVLFGADHATRVKLATAGRDNGLLFRRIVSEDFPSSTDPIDRVPRILALTGAVNQDVWSLRNLDFPVDFMTTATLNAALTDPLVNYDVIWNTGAWPGTTQPTARARLTAFFAAGGGYIGSGANGANFLTAGARDDRPHRRHERRERAQRHHPVAQRGRGQPDRRCVSRRGLRDRRPAELVHGGARDLLRGRAAPADELLPGGHVAEPGGDHGSGLSVRRPRHEQRRHGPARELRDEPALPGGSGARVADGRRGCLLGRPVDRLTT